MKQDTPAVQSSFVSVETPRSTRIRELPASEQPRARLMSAGVGALSVTELLAVLLGTDAYEPVLGLMAESGGLAGLLRVTVPELAQLPGMTVNRAVTLKAALELGRRAVFADRLERFQIKSPSDVANLMQSEMSHLDQEHFRVISIDTKNRVQCVTTVYIGSLNAASIRVGEVFKEALRINACAVILVHNHPSGDPTPSPEDVMVTRSIIEAGNLLDITVLDHIVIGAARFVSLKERGLAFRVS